MERSPIYPRRVVSPPPGPVARDGRRLGSSLWLLIDAWRRRPGPRRVLKTLSALMLVAGLLMFAYPFYTDIYADRLQAGLSRELRSGEARTAFLSRTIKPGEALTRIVVPRLGVDSVVVEGTTPSALRAGAGHYETTALPCERGNVAIAGHRTTYSKPFADTDRLRPGDEIVLETPIGKCWYEVTRAPFVISPRDWSVIAPTRGSFLTLTTCHPPGSAAERLVVRAELMRTELFTNDGTGRG